MQVLSAADAISPAIQRTKSLLFQPFRWGTFLKLCAVGVLTEGFSSNSNSTFRNHGSSGTADAMGSVHAIPGFQAPGGFQSFPLQWILAIAAIMALLLVVCVVVFYLITRLRFALFHCLVQQTTEIRPGWRLYKDQAWRFFLLEIAVGFAYFAIAIALAVPILLGLLHIYRSAQSSGNTDVGALISLLLPLFAVILVLIFVAVATDIVLRDWMLPHIALEDASARAAWAAVVERFRAEKGAFFFYGFLRLLLPLAATIITVLVFAIPIATLGIVLAGLHGATTGGSATSGIFIPLTAIFVLAGAVLAIFIMLVVGGPICIWIRSYALMFYGGRYRALGDLLFPAALPPAS